MVLPERQVDVFKKTAREIIADRVQGTARGFRERMGFQDMESGNYWQISNGGGTLL